MPAGDGSAFGDGCGGGGGGVGGVGDGFDCAHAYACDCGPSRVKVGGPFREGRRDGG